MSTAADTAHEFGALNTLLLVVILGLCILAAYLIKQNSFYYLPESAAAIIVGTIVGGLAKVVYPSTEELHFLTFESELFFFLLLPPIIFEAGYSLKKKDFFANFWSISLFAVFGTIISTFVIGYCIYFVGLMGWVEIDVSSPMEALVFGALISAVDPVATLSIMGNQELHCDQLLYALVFGESVLNDAVAIVLFKTFMEFYSSNEAFSSSTIPTIMVNFTVLSIGSIVVGIGAGLLCSYVCKHTNLHVYPEYEISILFLFAYGCYAFSESIGFSGIMSLFFNGIILSHYNSYNLSINSEITAHTIFKSLAVLCEFFIFLYIGMSIFTGTLKHINIFFTILALLFCLLGRVANIFPLSWLANLFRHQRKIPINMQVVMWFAGLRGAIAFALSQNMPLEHRQLYVSTTLLLVISTTMICGGLTEPMLSKMGMRSSGKNETDSDGIPDQNSSAHGLITRSNLEKLHNRAPSLSTSSAVSSYDPDEVHSPARISEGINTGNNNNSFFNTFRRRTENFMVNFERKYMNPLFGGPSDLSRSEDDTDIHGTFLALEGLTRSRANSQHSGRGDSSHGGGGGVSGGSNGQGNGGPTENPMYAMNRELELT